MKIKSPIIIIVFSLLVGLCAVLISFLPKIVVVHSAYEIKASQQEVSVFLSKADTWKKWFFVNADPSRRYLKIGADTSLNSGFKWFSKLEGDGALQIKQVTKDSISYEMISDNNQFREKGRFYLKVKENNTDPMTLITWVDSLDVSTSLFSRFQAKNEGFVKRMEIKNVELLKNMEKQINYAKNWGAN